MNPLMEVTEILRAKIETINPRNPKSNAGASLLKMHKQWETDLPEFVTTTFTTLQQQFSKSSSDNPAGTCRLTAVSISIGGSISRMMNRNPLSKHDEIRIGDIMLEGFKKAELIDLYYSGLRDNGYIVTATARWTLLADIPEALERMPLRATTLERPADITSQKQMTPTGEKAIVKNSDKRIDLTQPWAVALNKLQKVGWRINRRVLEAVLARKDMFVIDDTLEEDEDLAQKIRSKNVEWSFITQKAQKLRDEDAFYQYLDTDWRGRFYYIEPFLNFQGSDTARGLLNFARGKPMTEEGLQWLAIHTASVFNMSYGVDEIPDWCEADYKTYLEAEGLDNISVDKMTMEDRIRWTNDYMGEIIEAGRNSLMSDSAEKPVSFLAACFEWYDYSVAQKDKRIHMSHLPIPIDGSNNGWQHLGAISKDEETGVLVGLIPVEIQKDFYVQTAREMISSCTDNELSALLHDMHMKEIRKGISKRGSMTRAYSAGAKKIGENMYLDCAQEKYTTKYGITPKHCQKLASRLIKAIDVVCPGPLKTMTYLQDLAKFQLGETTLYDKDEIADKKLHRTLKERRKELNMIPPSSVTEEELQELNDVTVRLKDFNHRLTYGLGEKTLSWETPSGFKAVYENWMTDPLKMKATLDGQRITHVAQIPNDFPNIKGFMSGISPNFIHSLDSSHMALTIADWNEDFGAVHDSFSTHACDVDKLLQKTKEVFIGMYNVDNFYDGIESELITDKEGFDVKQPDRGNLKIEDIVESDYFFA